MFGKFVRLRPLKASSEMLALSSLFFYLLWFTQTRVLYGIPFSFFVREYTSERKVQDCLTWGIPKCLVNVPVLYLSLVSLLSSVTIVII